MDGPSSLAVQADIVNGQLTVTSNGSPKKSRPSKKGKFEVGKLGVEQMDPEVSLQVMTEMFRAEKVAEQKMVAQEAAETLKRLVAFSEKGMEGNGLVRTAIQRIQKDGVTGLERLSKYIEKSRREAYFQSRMVKGRLEKRMELLSKISQVKQELSERAASTADDERTRLWRQICRKQIPKAAKQLSASFTARLTNARRTAGFCVRETKKLWTRQGRLAKDSVGRARRQMREMMMFWKRNEREERELRKRAEKEAVEARRLEEEQREAKRQAKKLNFLLTQTELFSHFVARKTTAEPTAESHLDANVDLADVDDETLRTHAQKLAHEAAQRTRAQCDAFNDSNMDFSRAEGVSQTVIQPRMLQATLKEYQLKGLSWMAGLYEQGINGILADEMGLGKTIQAISLLAHLAETHDIWGPFIVVAPASTLHNWQQELARFVPSLRILPYWGNVADRKMLRKFWPSSSNRRPFGRSSTFHVLVTSYQLVVTDQAFLGKVRWQYMVLDEAQAIKSSASQRWNVLLSFQCRNRLLLTGTPIQNTMQELWALLHFIMPSLFDSHDEFSDWFAKDIESKAAADGSGKAAASSAMSGFDQHQLARLHTILKPFMLRRIKKDVQSELAPKVERDILCEMAPSQKKLYKAIRQRIPMAELLRSASSDSEASASLMNLVMQFRKVCNHPELFERRTVQSPLIFCRPDTSSSNNYWPGPRASALDSFIPLHLVSVELSETIKLGIENPYHEIYVREPSVELDICVVPESIRFLEERWPSAYIPSVVSPTPHVSIEHSVSKSPSTLIPAPYSTGRQILVPEPGRMLQDCGKLAKLDELLTELKAGGHRVLLYNQMTRMIDLMEEYLQYRQYRYLRLDGSTKIADRRDMVNDWQSDPSIFIFLLSTRAGGLGINLTAADTVIFYDSDWNPTVDQQAMDRAHRLGQQKQVTVYRLLTKGTVEERIQVRAQQKDLVQKVVIAGGDFRAEQAPLRAKDVASLLLDEDDSSILLNSKRPNEGIDDPLPSKRVK